MAEPVNQYAISRILGSRVRPIGRPRFGGFGMLGTTAELLGATDPGETPDLLFDKNADALIAEAFEAMRDGYAPGRILWSKAFAERFIDECRVRGISLPETAIKRRLIHIRKNKAYAQRAGITFSPTTKREPRAGLDRHDAYAIEFALVRLRYRCGRSIDDILLDERFADEFESIARSVGATLSGEDLRLGALNLRKSRKVSKRSLPLFDRMDADVFERAMSDIGDTTSAAIGDVPGEPGIVTVVEPKRYLFVLRHVDLREVVAPLLEHEAWDAMADEFWTPDRSQIKLSIYVGQEFKQIKLPNWQLKLIREREPVFNWPIAS